MLKFFQSLVYPVIDSFKLFGRFFLSMANLLAKFIAYLV